MRWVHSGNAELSDDKLGLFANLRVGVSDPPKRSFSSFENSAGPSVNKYILKEHDYA